MRYPNNTLKTRLKEATDFAFQRFNELKRKGYEWHSFYNGIIEYWSFIENKNHEKRKKYYKNKKYLK